MVDEWGRPPSLADVPLTIMTRKDALIKQGNNDKTIDKLYKELWMPKKKGKGQFDHYKKWTTDEGYTFIEIQRGCHRVS